MIYLFFISVFIILTNIIYKKDFLSPSAIFVYSWTISVIASYLVLIEAEYELNYVTIVIVTVGMVLFVVSSWATRTIAGRGRMLAISGASSIINPPSKLAVYIVLSISVLILPFFIRDVVQLAVNGPTDIWFMNLRFGMTQGEGVGWPAYGLSFANLALISIQIRSFVDKSKVIKWIKIIAIIVTLTYVILSTGRTFILQSAFFYFVPGIVTGRYSALKVVGYGSLVGLIVFSAYSIILQKGVTGTAYGPELVFEVYNGLLVYAAGGIFGLDHIVTNPTIYPFGANTFRFFLAIGERLGFGVEPVELVRGFITYPVLTNVYSYYSVYIEDFGILVAIATQILLGIMYGSMYHSLTSKKDLHYSMIVIYSASLYPLFMQFFQDQYVSLLSTWFQYLLIFLVMRIITRLIK